MKKTISFILIITSLISPAQNGNIINLKTEVKKQDVSNLWISKKLYWTFEGHHDSVNRPSFLGYIGDNFYRFDIQFIYVKKNYNDSLEYDVSGKTRINNRICRFKGKLKILEAKTINNEWDTTSIQGHINGNYCFYEDPKDKGTGMLTGKFETFFYLDSSRTIKYYFDIGDAFFNNQFEGTWVSYDNKIKKKCNWGDYRIPDSKGLDGGACEFIPMNKYVKNGWEHYYKQFSNDSLVAKKAIKEEGIKW